MDNFGQDRAQYSPSPTDYKLKWHKFLIYFSLWASALSNGLSGYQAVIGAHYGPESDQVYAIFGSGLRSLDMVMGFALFAIAAYSIYVRFQLADFRIGAPKKLTMLYIAHLAIGFGYILAVSAATKLPLSQFSAPDMFSSIIGSVAMIFINQNYYNKRMELFIH